MSPSALVTAMRSAVSTMPRLMPWLKEWSLRLIWRTLSCLREERGGYLETISACGWKQEHHYVTHLLYVDFALADANCFDDDVAVARCFAQLHDFVSVLSEPLNNAK